MNAPLLFVFLLFISVHASESENPSYYSCGPNNGHAPLIPKSNFSAFLDNLTSVANHTGYGTAFHKESNRGKVYGLAQCREDVVSANITMCSDCIKKAKEKLDANCSDQSDTTIIYEYCLLRYKNASFFGEIETNPSLIYINVVNVTGNNTLFNQKLRNLMQNISAQAIQTGQKGLGKGKRQVDTLGTLYALVQCTEDLSPMSCKRCLDMAYNNIDQYCHNKTGCQVIFTSCFARYEIYTFFYPLDSKNGSSLVGGTGNYESSSSVAVAHVAIP